MTRIFELTSCSHPTYFTYICPQPHDLNFNAKKIEIGIKMIILILVLTVPFLSVNPSKLSVIKRKIKNQCLMPSKSFIVCKHHMFV